MISAAVWHNIRHLEFCPNGPYSICGEAIAQSMLTGRVSVAFPCWGDRKTVLYLDDELVGVIPFKIIEEWIEGVRVYPQNRAFLPYTDLASDTTSIRTAYKIENKVNPRVIA